MGWPGPEECQRTRRVDLTTVASTWLAVSAKNIEYAYLLNVMYTFRSFHIERLPKFKICYSTFTLHVITNKRLSELTAKFYLKEANDKACMKDNSILELSSHNTLCNVSPTFAFEWFSQWGQSFNKITAFGI